MKNNTLIFFFLLLLISTVRAQNVGIGTKTPQYTLDVAGRMSLLNGTQTAGVYFDYKSYIDSRAFAGLYTDNLGGFYGSGSNWNFLVNMINGNIGIGTVPAAGLDVNGGIRIQSGNPTLGATVMSADANGNATFKKPVLFKVSGTGVTINDGIDLSNAQWAKPEFSTISDYNIGLTWAPVAQYFTAPVKGVYHFDFCCQTISFDTYTFSCRLIRRRNGTDTEVFYTNNGGSIEGTSVSGQYLADACVDLALEPSDQVWVEIRGSSKNAANPCSYRTAPQYLSFSGRLVSYL